MLLYFFGQTCGPAGSEGGGGNPLMSFLPLILIIVVFYFLLILPQQRRQKKHQKMLQEINKGDRVITSSGMYGTIANVKERSFIVVIADGVKVEIEKGHITNVLNKPSESQSSN
jgi:preprotein translocase subunit YajC